MVSFFTRILFIIFLPFYVCAYKNTNDKLDKIDLNQDNKLLPDIITVYYDEINKSISSKEVKNFQKVSININSDNKGFPGCYIACFSAENILKENLISFSNTKYLLGLIRVSGYHKNQDCVIKGYELTEASETEELSAFCIKSFPSYCQNNNCWADNKTSIYWQLAPYTLSIRRGMMK
jgi:hypothetical protein